jgi:hypothetical protein
VAPLARLRDRLAAFILTQADVGRKVSEVCDKYGIPDATY